MKRIYRTKQTQITFRRSLKEFLGSIYEQPLRPLICGSKVQKTAMERQKFKFRDSEECHIHWDISCTSGDVAFTGKLLNISLLWKMIDAILPDVISTMGALSSMLAIKS